MRAYHYLSNKRHLDLVFQSTGMHEFELMHVSGVLVAGATL